MTIYQQHAPRLGLDQVPWIHNGNSKFDWGISTLTTQTRLFIHNLTTPLRNLIEVYTDPIFLKSIGIDSFVSDNNTYYDLTEITVTPEQTEKLTDLYNKLISEQKWTLDRIRWPIWMQSIQMLYKRLLDKDNTICILGSWFWSEKYIRLYMKTKWWQKSLKELGFRLPIEENYEYNINNILPKTACKSKGSIWLRYIFSNITPLGCSTVISGVGCLYSVSTLALTI